MNFPALILPLINKVTYCLIVSLVGFTTIVMASAAKAQDEVPDGSRVGLEPTKVMVVDLNNILDRSIALEDIDDRLNQLIVVWEADIQETQQRLADHRAAARNLMEAEDPDLLRVEVELQAKEQALLAQVEARNRQLNDFQVRARRLIRTQIIGLAHQMMEERGANMIINKNQGIWVPNDLDLTEAVLERLNNSYVQVLPVVEAIDAQLDQVSDTE